MVSLAITVLRWEIVIIFLQCVTSKEESLTFLCSTSMIWYNIAYFISYYALDVLDGPFLDELMIKQKTYIGKKCPFYFFLTTFSWYYISYSFCYCCKKWKLEKSFHKSMDPSSKYFTLTPNECQLLISHKWRIISAITWKPYATEKTKVSQSLGDEISYIFLNTYI